LKSYNERIIRALQEQYYNDEPRALTMIYCEARHIADVLLTSMLASKKLILPTERIDQIVHDAASRFVSQYLKRPGFWVDHFAVRIKWEVKYFLFDGGHRDRPKQVSEMNTVSLDTVQPIMKEKDTPENRKDFIEDIYTEHEHGADILLAIKNASNFRSAVLAVAEITGKSWCYDRAMKLREVYRMTRRKGKVEHATRRRSNGRVYRKRESEALIGAKG